MSVSKIALLSLIGIICVGLSVSAIAKKPEQGPIVEMKTSKGTIVIELYEKKAPVTCANFLKYVNDGFYNGTIFHRVIPNFMIQGGGFETGLRQKSSGQPIVNEAGNGLSNARGTIAMARTQDVNSATAQFFINHQNNPFLDHRDESQEGYGYCVFGKVIEGMHVVDQIAAAKTGISGYYHDVPEQDVVIEKVSVAKKKK